MYDHFGLVLMVNHACNLRCTYCYTGAKFSRAMPEEVGRRAIDRAIASLNVGGRLELGFFGGEPLVESRLISALVDHAQRASMRAGRQLELGLTTNGTICNESAWSVMTLPAMDLAVSHDGLPEVHDHHRRSVEGAATSAVVGATMRRLIEAGKPFRVIMVVRPDTVDRLSDGIRYLRTLGARSVEPSLDLWTAWPEPDMQRLERAVDDCAELWRAGLPDFGISWFDEKAAHLARVPLTQNARCGFGDGEIAVAPSGNLYPCERLIGDDSPLNSMRLPGHVLDAGARDFLGLGHFPARCDEECNACAMQDLCNSTCRCSNFVRSGDPKRPDGLLCRWNQACLLATARMMRMGARAEKFSAASPARC
jgi:uncharacterized protein